jgi:hypothetical protein
MSLALSNMRNKRRPKPEPLEQVKALVCGRCWTNCFDTEGFEKLGRLEITEFKYTVSGRESRSLPIYVRVEPPNFSQSWLFGCIPTL